MGNFVVLERSPHPELAEVLSRVRFAVQEGQSQNAVWGRGACPTACSAHTCGSTACPAHHPISWQPTCLQKMPKQSRIKTKKLILRPGHAGAGKDYECCQRSSVQAEHGDVHVCLHVYISHTASLSPLGTFPL